MLDKVKKVAAATGTDTAPKHSVMISPPNFQAAKLTIKGTAPYVMNKMSSANRQKMIETQEAGQRSRKGAKREPKNFQKVFEGAQHVSKDGWYGIPASALRAAMISACKVVGFQMTKAKLCIFIEPDGFDRDDGQPLVRINGSEPVRRDMAVKLADGSTDIIARPFFEDWSANVTVKWDGDLFSAEDVVNLLSRAGVQVGIGSGRPDSKTSTGMGWGTFEVHA